MNENQCNISSPKVLVGPPVPRPVQYQLSPSNIICSSNFCNIITLPSASVIHVVNGQPVAASPTMQNNHGQPNVNVVARPQLVQVKPVVIYQSPITVVKPVVYANKVPQQQQLCGNCGVTSKLVGQRCCGKFRPIEKPKLLGRNRLPAQGSSSMQAKRSNSSIQTKKFYSNGQGAEDFQNFLHASMAENFVQVKRSRMMLPSDTVHHNKPEFITISDSSDESESETVAQLSPDLVSTNGDKDMIGLSNTSNNSIKSNSKLDDDSPIPLKKLKQQSPVTQNGLQENGCSPLLTSTPKQLPITVPVSEHWLYEAITVTMTSVRVGQYHHCGVTQGQFSGKRIAMSLNEVILQIDWFAIVEVEICPEDLHPCMFITLASEFVPNVRSQLGMEPGKIPYFDPGGTDDCKYIIFYLCPKFYKMNWKNLMDKFQVIRKKLKRPTDFVSVMTAQQANERQMSIAGAELAPHKPATQPETQASKQLTLQKPAQLSGHILSRPPTTCNSPLNGSFSPDAITPNPGLPRLTRSRAPGFTTSHNPSSKSATESIDVHPPFSGPRLQLAIYPPPPAKGGICITNEDQYCLNDGEFLNDVIIDFYLKYIMEQMLSARDRERSHVFSCFFYKRLTQNLASLHHCEDKSLNPAERRHRRVMKWTRGVDIFAKDFVFIPINEASHWYIAVVCFPGQTGGKLVDAETGQIMSEALARIQAISPTPDDQVTASTPTTPTSGSQSDQPSAENGKTVDDNLVLKNPSVAKLIDASGNIKQSSGLDCLKSKAVQSNSPCSQAHMKTLQVKIAKIRVTVPAKSVLVKHADPAPKQVDSSKSDAPVSTTKPDQSNAVSIPPTRETTATNTDPGVKPGKEGVHTPHPCPSPTGGAPSSKAEVPSARRKKQSQYREPCILIFDSLRGPTRSRTSLILREYLKFEWKTRKEAKCGSREFDKHTMKMNTPVVPQQDNYSDCGLFLLQYVQQMFQNPITNFILPIKDLQRWFDPNLCKLKRKEIDSIIKKLHEQQTKPKNETS